MLMLENLVAKLENSGQFYHDSAASNVTKSLRVKMRLQENTQNFYQFN